MIKLNALSESDVGRAVTFTYHHGSKVYGKLSSWNDEYIFVLFGSGDTAQACEPDQCTLGLKLGLNATVRVRLNSLGVSIMKDNHDALFNEWVTAPRFEPRPTDENGMTKFTLLEILTEFGRYVIHGSGTPFENNEIQFDETIVAAVMPEDLKA